MSDFWTEQGFIKAAASTDSGTCFMQRRSGSAVEIGDSKDHRSMPDVLSVSPVAYAALLRLAQSGQLDRLSA